jgi:hypothetical protein
MDNRETRQNRGQRERQDERRVDSWRRDERPRDEAKHQEEEGLWMKRHRAGCSFGG